MVEEATEDSFHGVDVAFISASSEVSLRLAPAAVAAGAVVIDDSSAFRMEPNVPLVVPEVNGDDIEWHQGIIAIPNCSTTPLVMAALPLHREVPVRRVVADTYQSVSGAGAALMADLREQSARLQDQDSRMAASSPGQIAYNVIPQIDRFLDSGYTMEEQKMRQETQKILHEPDIRVSATCVRVPVYISHCAAVHLELEQPMTAEHARELMGAMPGLTVLDDPAAGMCRGTPCRVRGSGLAFWVVAGEDDRLKPRVRGPGPSRRFPRERVGLLGSLRQPPQGRSALNSLQIGLQPSPGRLDPGCPRPPKAPPNHIPP